VLLVGWTFAFFFHLANGLRHLCWDLGLGYGKAHIQASGWAVVLVTVIATAAFALAAIV
jgi:succinate dehydrogenase / fumarate reductase, cytochrome b subunit